MFGFAALYSLQAEDSNNSTGNAALQDQTAALQWAHDNVANFGGDPDKIHMFGESAGGFSVAWHTVSSASAGLYSSATMESGTTDATEFFTPLHDGECLELFLCSRCMVGHAQPFFPTAVTFTTEFASSCGCNMTSQPALAESDPLLVCLRALPTEALMKSLVDALNPDWPFPPAKPLHTVDSISQLYSDLGVPKHLSPPQYLPALAPLMAWGPAIDGSPAGLRDMPLTLISKGEFNRVSG
jgi:acetyl esterase/lipase